MLRKALKVTGHAVWCGFILMGYSMLPIPTETYSDDLMVLESHTEVVEEVNA